MATIESSTRDRITTIVLNRPDKLNAFAGTMREEILRALRSAEGDRACHVVVITGAGRAFCAGGDVDFMRQLQRQRDVDAFRKLLDAGRDVVLQISGMSKPAIASINGVAAGAGCNLALACDYRIASDQARLGRNVCAHRSPSRLGRNMMVDADEALAIGLVDRVVASADLPAETGKLASAIATGPPSTITDIKRALSASERNGLQQQIALESEHQLRAFLSADAEEGMTAFAEKRAPRFSR